MIRFGRQIRLGLGLWVLAVWGLLFREPRVLCWLYVPLWWGLILLCDALFYRLRRLSLFRAACKNLAGFLLLSATFWFFFEACNLRLANWSYLNLEPLPLPRWAGYFISYATVLPAYVLAKRYWGLAIPAGNPSEAAKPEDFAALGPLVFLCGAILFLDSLLLPRYFFPLVWIGPFLLLEGLIIRLRLPSLLISCSRGDWAPLFSCFLSGLCLGFIWEALNWISGGRWIYHLPYLNSPKLFEMPLAGYLGFGFFGLICQAFLTLAGACLPGATPEPHDSPGRDRGRAGGGTRLWLIAALAVCFDLIICHLIDTHTVRSFL